MTRKNLKPQQAAPVQREINTTSSVVGLISPLALSFLGQGTGSFCGRRRGVVPFILILTSKSVKSLLTTAKSHGLPQRN